MAEIEFQRHEDHFALLNPLKGFAQDTQTVEVRVDPLLGHTSVYNPLVEGGFKMFVGDADRGLIERLRAEGEPRCFFCPDRIGGVARFPEGFVPEGTIRVGESVLFPNLFALARHHAVAVVSHAHFLDLQAFTPALLGDAFRAAHRYVQTVYAHDADADHVSVNANYLFPAGASLMHPHFQVLVTAKPYTQQARLVEACRGYAARHASAYHRDLIATERRLGERYIGQTGPWHWLAAFAPMGSNEILGIHEHGGDFAALAEADLDDLARGLSAMLHAYGRLGYLSFNFSLVARRAPAAEDGFNSLIRCITRQNPYPNYRTDDFFLQKGLQAELILKLPEALAVEVRPEIA